MNQKQKKKKGAWQQYIPMVFFALLGAVCGYLMMRYIHTALDADTSLDKEILALAGLFVGVYVAIFLQMFIHETGHLLFGLLSGYTFSSFRIFRFMWIKEGEKIKCKRLTLAGTGGQCLMTPPDMKDGKIPVVLYNLGGSLMNILAGLAFLGFFFICEDHMFLSTLLLLLAVSGLLLAIMNGVPLRMGTVDNDGYNAYSLTRNQEAMRCFWVQMAVSGQTAKGVRLKDMPEEWFAVPSDEAMKNSMVAVMGVFACNRLMDADQLAEADALMAHMLEIDSGMVGLHRQLMICDRMYVELMGQNRREILDGMLTKEQKRFMESMRNFPSVLRTKYVYALLSERDAGKAARVKAQFEKCAKTYPYPQDVQAERELMEKAEDMCVEAV